MSKTGTLVDGLSFYRPKHEFPIFNNFVPLHVHHCPVWIVVVSYQGHSYRKQYPHGGFMAAVFYACWTFCLIYHVNVCVIIDRVAPDNQLFLPLQVQEVGVTDGA